MLQHTFCHIPRVSQKIEEQLWTAGIHSWPDLTSTLDLPDCHLNREYLCRSLEESATQLAANNARWFAGGLPSNLHWRLFPEFRSRTAYLDIETTGLSGATDHITTIALYDGQTIRWYIQGQNLEQFAADVRDYRVLVTYNGKCFDLPFLRSYLGVEFDQAHIDLRYVLRKLGYRGGLKGCEKQMGIHRNELDGVDGFMAVKLWWEYENRRDPRALETLLSYNIEDVLNLETLLVMAYNLEIQATPFQALRTLPLPVLPPNPFPPDVSLIRRLLGPGGWFGDRRAGEPEPLFKDSIFPRPETL